MFVTQRGTVSGFFLAGRFMTWIPIGASLFASNIGSEHFIGLAGSGAASGIGVGAFELNQPYFFRSIFTRMRVKIELTPELARGLSSIATSGLGVLTCIHRKWGGLAAVLYTDTLQCFVMLIGAILLASLSFVRIGGFTGLVASYGQAIAHIDPQTANDADLLIVLANITLTTNITSRTELAAFPGVNPSLGCSLPSTKAFRLLREVNDPDMPWLGFILGQTPASIWYWCADQMMVQRVLSAKSLSHAQGATLMAGLIKQLPLFIMVIPGMISRVLFPRLRGLMLAVMLAALVSDLTSIFNSASTLFTVDIYGRFRKNPKESELMLVGRLFVVFLVLVSIAWIPVVQELQGSQLFIYIQEVGACLAPPIAAVYLLSILSRRCNEAGSFYSLLYGLLIGITRMILSVVYSGPVCGEPDDRPWIISQVHYMYFAVFSFLSTGILMTVISLLGKPPSTEQVHRLTYFTAWDPLVPALKVLDEQRADNLYTVVDEIPFSTGDMTALGNQVKSQGNAPSGPTEDLAPGHLEVKIKSASVETLHCACSCTTQSGFGQCALHALRWLCGCEDRPCTADVEENCLNCLCCGKTSVRGPSQKTRCLESGTYDRERDADDPAVRFQKIISLHQDPRAKVALTVGLIAIIIISLFGFIFFSVFFTRTEAGPIPLKANANATWSENVTEAIQILENVGVIRIV
ncbi:solute carrier family 5 (sodium/myo-inositol cotransporter), member 3 [Paragonimus westermani]|uniref:Solute carrier family 5 (Sodium/myo-inositol cotransporter), member 3 n=1 Tax=Paragonimus westermani TaxID=34504 RepID=A0A5J4NID4_9TREM|nr:solute carrier family 5 (sodium/myo-inositol cotransporter), member 3 [Paragonimus westermani]